MKGGAERKEVSIFLENLQSFFDHRRVDVSSCFSLSYVFLILTTGLVSSYLWPPDTSREAVRHSGLQGGLPGGRARVVSATVPTCVVHCCSVAPLSPRLLGDRSSQGEHKLCSSRVSLEFLSSLSLKTLPPSFDVAFRRTPPSREALRHSGGESLR